MIPCALALLFSPIAAYAAGPKGDVYLGYSRLGTDVYYPNVGGLNGWEGALHVKVKSLAGLEGDLSQYGLGADSSIPRTTAFMGGPRITVGALGFRAFVHALGGIEHSANSSGVPISGNAVSYALGGGVETRILPFFAWRVAGDYLGAPTLNPSTSAHYRVSTGLVFRF
jgi:hypothetical protein